MIGSLPDRLPYPCGACQGRREVQRIVIDPETVPSVGRTDGAPLVQVETVKCDGCNGLGIITPADGDRVEVYQDGFLVGSCLVPARARAHPMYSMRPGDFLPAVKVGKMIYVANTTLGLGDLAYLVGWSPARREGKGQC